MYAFVFIIQFLYLFFLPSFLKTFFRLTVHFLIRRKCTAMLSKGFAMSRYISSILYRCRFVNLSGTPKSNYLYLAQGLLPQTSSMMMTYTLEYQCSRPNMFTLEVQLNSNTGVQCIHSTNRS